MGVNTTRHPASRLCRSVPADTRRQSRAGGRKQGMARGCRAGLWARSGLKVVRMRRSLQKSAVGMIFTSLQSDNGVCATRDADSGVQWHRARLTWEANECYVLPTAANFLDIFCCARRRIFFALCEDAA